MGRLNPSRETKFSGTHGDRGILSVPVQLTTSRIGNLTRLIHTLLYVMIIHTYIHTYIHTVIALRKTRLGSCFDPYKSCLDPYNPRDPGHNQSTNGYSRTISKSVHTVRSYLLNVYGLLGKSDQ